MPNLEKMQPIAKRLVDQCWESGLNSLGEHDQVFYLAWCYAGELNNGGHHAFFYNSEVDNYRETINALQKLGLPLFAELLQCAAGLLFVSDVPRSMGEGNAVIDQLPDNVAIDEQFEELNRRYFDQGGGNHVLDVLENWYFQQAGAGG